MFQGTSLIFIINVMVYVSIKCYMPMIKLGLKFCF